jgi:hypothetical protein
MRDKLNDAQDSFEWQTLKQSLSLVWMDLAQKVIRPLFVLRLHREGRYKVEIWISSPPLRSQAVFVTQFRGVNIFAGVHFGSMTPWSLRRNFLTIQ